MKTNLNSVSDDNEKLKTEMKEELILCVILLKVLSI